MKDHRKFMEFGLLIAPCILSLTLPLNALAQETGSIKFSRDENPLSLQVENLGTHKKLFFVVGQTLVYKILSSPQFEKGRITGITDSTISLENKKLGNVTIAQKDLTKIKIPKIRAGGIALMAIGAIGLVAVAAQGKVQNDASGVVAGTLAIVLDVSVPLLVGGAALVAFNRSQRIHLGPLWALHATSAIVPGNIINVTTKSGEVVKIKVTRIDSEKIVGNETESSQTHAGQPIHYLRTIRITDIKECTRNIN